MMTLSTWRLALAALLVCAACASAQQPERGRVELRPFADHVWLHTTWRDLPGIGPFPSHGLVVADGDSLLLIDSAWGEEETRELVARVERETGRRVSVLISTHHHDDRASGIAWLRARGVRTLGHPLAPPLALARGLGAPTPVQQLADIGSAVRIGPVEVFYPGPGHAVDNVVVWLPEQRILFGGCAVRPGDTRSLGNTADADVAEWPRSIARVRARYGDSARVVIPGHGEPRGPELLTHTISLFQSPAGQEHPR